MLLLAAPLFAQVSDRLQLKYGDFDPVTGHPAISPALRGAADTRLWIVQFGDQPTDSMRSAVRATGAQIHGYLPHNAYVVRMPRDVALQVRMRHDVRWVGHYHHTA